MAAIAPKIQSIEVELSDWRFDVPQEGSETIVLTSYRTIEYCTFTNGNHKVSDKTSKGKILTQYECVAWIYRTDLQRAMMKAL